MTLEDLIDNWDDIPYDRKVNALQIVVDFLKAPYQKDEDLIYDMLSPLVELEIDDYFGTEGLKV